MSSTIADPGQVLVPDDDLRAFRREIRDFIDEQQERLGFVPQCDSWMSSHSPEFSRALGERGWIGLTWPRRYGGSEQGELARFVLNEELLAAGAPVAAHWFADRQIGPALLRNGTEEQRECYLPQMTRGECFFAIGMSEPDSGSDLASVRTSAVKTAGGWRISGTKVWTSHAHVAQHMLALIRTSPLEESKRHEGLSQVIIDLAAPGVTVRPITSLDGSVHFNEVVLDDVAVLEGALLGEQGAGWKQVTAELANERSGPERFLSTAPLLFELMRRRQPRVDSQIGGILAELQTLRALSRKVAEALERGESPVLQAALVKDLGTQFESRVIAAVRELASVEPDLRSTDPLSRLLAEAVLHAPDATLRGGTNEILRGIISRSLVPR